jgi:hypothetical protein
VTILPSPIIVQDPERASIRQLLPIPLSQRLFDESWLQALLLENPSLVPAADIDERYEVLLPVCREFPVPSGSIDVLYVTRSGHLCLVETKLWRNPEAHRSVVAQIIDYAKDLASLDYREFELRVRDTRAARGMPPKSLVEIAGAKGEDGGILFEERVSRVLGQGEFLLLIVGDRIRPQVLLLSESVAGAPHLEFTIGLVQLNLYRGIGESDWPLLVVPSVVGRTAETTRGVIKIRYEQEKPRVEAAPIDEERIEGRPGRANKEVFLKSIPARFEEVFRPYLEEWGKGQYVLFWGKVGFSLRIPYRGRLKTIFDAYPIYFSVFRRERAQEWAGSDEAYQDYVKELSTISAVHAVLISGGRYVHYDVVSPDDLETLLRATDVLISRLVSLPQ